MNRASFINRRPGLRRAKGFSIIELMVSVVIGMLAIMFATRLITGGEQNKQAALGGSDAMQNGMMAMFSISNDMSQAGYGLNDPLLMGCDTTMGDKGGAGYHLATVKRGGADITPLSPAIIESNGVEPDRISLYAGASMTGTASVRLIQAFTGGTTVLIDRKPYGFANNDVIVIAPELSGGKCSLVQLSETPDLGAASPALRFETGGGRRYNSGAVVNNTPVRSRAFNLGPAKNLALHTWSVSGGFLQLSATDLPNSEGTAATVADNIVSIKGQYGFDTRTVGNFLPENGTNVSVWSSTMIDADGDGVEGGAGDYQRISAIRVAVVARSKSPQRPKPGLDCDATAEADMPKVFTSALPTSAAATPITVNVVVAGDTVDKKCYRYRVFETVVPVRNTAWRPTAWAS
jgi:type IV pilus assembly protein PilW